MRVAYVTETLPPVVDGVSRTLCKPRRELFFADLEQFQPDLIHWATPTLSALQAMRYARERGVPVVASYHTHFVSYFRYYGLRPLEPAGWSYLRWFYNRAELTYAPSPTARRELLAHGFRNVELWRRGIDLAQFSPRFRDAELRREIGAEHVPVALFVGRLVKEKDLDDLVGASALLRARGVAFKLALVGDGPMRPELERRLPDAYFAGSQQGARLSRWYASADVFAFPSTTETFGNVVQEAFASGLPVVTAGKGGVVDLITPGRDGLLAEPNDARDFADKLELLLTDRALRERMGRHARATAARSSWTAVNRRLLASYEAVVSLRQTFQVLPSGGSCARIGAPRPLRPSTLAPA